MRIDQRRADQVAGRVDHAASGAIEPPDRRDPLGKGEHLVAPPLAQLGVEIADDPVALGDHEALPLLGLVPRPLRRIRNPRGVGRAAVGERVGEVHTLIAHSFGVPMALWAQVEWGLRAQRQVLFSSLDHCNWVTEEFARLVGLPPSVMERGRQLMVQRSAGRMAWERLAVGDLLCQTRVPTLMLHDTEDPEVPIDHLFNVMARCGADRPVDVHVTDGLGHHRLLGDPSVLRRVLAFVGSPA